VQDYLKHQDTGCGGFTPSNSLAPTQLLGAPPQLLGMGKKTGRGCKQHFLQWSLHNIRRHICTFEQLFILLYLYRERYKVMYERLTPLSLELSFHLLKNTPKGARLTVPGYIWLLLDRTDCNLQLVQFPLVPVM